MTHLIVRCQIKCDATLHFAFLLVQKLIQELNLRKDKLGILMDFPCVRKGVENTQRSNVSFEKIHPQGKHQFPQEMKSFKMEASSYALRNTT